MKVVQWLYNPFKPHIHQMGANDYTIRKFQLFEWVYLDCQSEALYWWGQDYAPEFCSFSKKTTAIARLEEYNRLTKE